MLEASPQQSAPGVDSHSLWQTNTSERALSVAEAALCTHQTYKVEDHSLVC